MEALGGRGGIAPTHSNRKINSLKHVWIYGRWITRFIVTSKSTSIPRE
jgi:hypothetical protein